MPNVQNLEQLAAFLEVVLREQPSAAQDPVNISFEKVLKERYAHLFCGPAAPFKTERPIRILREVA